MAWSLSSSARCLHQATQRSNSSIQGAPCRSVPLPVLPSFHASLVELPQRSAGLIKTPSRCSVVTQAVAKAPSTVKIIIQGRKLQVTDAIKQYVESKISHSLAHYGQEVREVDVTLSARGGDTGTHGKKEQRVEVTLFTIRNGVVRVEEAEDTLYAAIDLVCDKLSRKMTRVKERAIAKGTWPGRAGPKDSAAEEQDFKQYMQEVAYETAVFTREEELRKQFADLNKAFPAVVRRTKIVELEPMTVDEAIDAMEAVGHSFYMFREAETDEIQVVYRRETEGYGVLIPRKRQ